MSKWGKSGGTKQKHADAGWSKVGTKEQPVATKKAAVDPDADLVVTGTFKGKIRDVDVDLITGDVTQTNSSAQGASNVSKGGGANSQATNQTGAQVNEVFVQGSADLDIIVTGSFKGKIRDVEVGLITGDVVQANYGDQAALNLAVGGSGAGGSQAIAQSFAQGNYLAAVGDVEVDMVFSGNFRGTVRDIEVGLITGDVTQANWAKQAAANIAFGAGGGSQAIGQAADQVNILVAVGDVDVILLFEGDFRGEVRDVTVGLITGDVSQTNSAIQVGMNITAGRHKGSQSIDQFITQTNSIDAEGDLDVVIRFDCNYKGDYRDIDINLMIDNVIQSNAAAQYAHNATVDAVWG